MFVGPEVVKPLDHPLLQVLANLGSREKNKTFGLPHLSKAHVLLYGVHLVPELSPWGVHVGDHWPNVPHDCGEDEHTNEEVDGDKEVLEVAFGLRRLSDGGEGEGWPVEAVDVLRRQRVVLVGHGVVVHPLVLPEPDEEADGEEDAGVPVDEDHDENDNLEGWGGKDQISK